MHLDPALNLLEEIVVTEGKDAGVILLSSESTFHKVFIPTLGKEVEYYDNQYFSPLGDALIKLYEILLEREQSGRSQTSISESTPT